MDDERQQLKHLKGRLRASKKVSLRVPSPFTFKRSDAKQFDPVLQFFDWTIRDCPVEIDLSDCYSANYQALSLLIPYCWHLKQSGCDISIRLDHKRAHNPSSMWTAMGGPGLFAVATDTTTNFRSSPVKPLFAVRNPADLRASLDKSEAFVAHFGVEYQQAIRHILAELLYNAMEHGRREFRWKGKSHLTPATLQLSWYEKINEIDVLVADIGMGIQAHLSQAYPGIATDEEALRLSIQPEVSGTFGRHDPYTDRNNAGMGLFISSSLARRLRADMHIVSGESVLHISPSDTTAHPLKNPWPGTFVLLTMKLDQAQQFVAEQILHEAREEAAREVSQRLEQEVGERFYVHVNNHFGSRAEDKSAAIRFRDHQLMPAVEEGKVVVLDFDRVRSATHSFVNALLASPIRRMGMQAYKRIKVTRAGSDIREIVDYVMDDNTSPEGISQAKYELDGPQMKLDMPKGGTKKD